MIARVYDAVVDPSLWGGIVSDLVDAADASGGSYLTSDVETGSSEVVMARQSDPHLDDFTTYYAMINPLVMVSDVRRYASDWTPIMSRDENWIERSAFERSEYYNDYLRPRDACRGFFMRLGLSGSLLTTINLMRGYRREQVSDGEMAMFAPFHRHAVRATALGRRFSDVRRFGEGATAAINEIDDAMLLLDRAGRIVHANPAADRMMSEEQLISGSFDRLAGVGARRSEQLTLAIARAAGPKARAGSLVDLAGADAVRAVTASVVPIGCEAALEAANGPAVLVRVTADQSARRVSERLDRLGLTGAERSLILLLLQGKNLREASTARGVSFHTSRSQLASVFDKAGVHRQAELVNLLIRDA